MTSTHETPKRSILWPGMVFILIGISVTLMSITAYLAVSDRSFAVEEDYYAKAVAWDQSAQAAERSRALGWNAQVILSPQTDLGGQRSITVLLHDRNGAPIENAAPEAFAFHHARRGEPVRFTLAQIAPGRYAAGAPLQRDGLWQVRLRITRGEEVFLTTANVNTSDSTSANTTEGQRP